MPYFQMPYVQLELGRAVRAARVLAADPDDLPQVFTIIESLSGTTLQRVARRMKRTEAGRRLIESRPDVVERLADRGALARLPSDTLGRAYLDFVEREGISADGIRAAGDAGTTKAKPMPPELEWVNSRLRDTHDLWHAAVGYSGDVLGETALLAFSFAQTWNPAIGLILGIGLSKTAGESTGGADARRTILEGFRRGRRAAWLPAEPWEALLDQPLVEVRQRLSLGAPPVYTPIRSDELRAANVIARTPPHRAPASSP